MRAVETLIVGGGQAGLAVSRCLTAQGADHVVVERGRIAERWRSARWDSLRLLTPNWQTRLPGHDYAAGQQHHAVGQRLRLVHEVGREEDRLAQRAEVLDRRPRLAAGGRVEAGRRLVEEQKLRVKRQSARDSGALDEVLVIASALSVQDVRDRHGLIISGEGGRGLLLETLEERGAHVQRAECYRRARPSGDAGDLIADMTQALDKANQD